MALCFQQGLGVLGVRWVGTGGCVLLLDDPLPAPLGLPGSGVLPAQAARARA